MPIPKEHGAWVVLYASFLIGAASVGRFEVEIPIFWVAVTAFFLARHPLVRLAATVPLLFYYQLGYLIPMGTVAALVLLAYLYLSGKRVERRLLGEFLGVFGLTLTAPGAYYVMQGRLDNVRFTICYYSF